MTHTLTTSSVTLPGGVVLPYLEEGDPDGVPVVFLHGYTDSCHAFEPLLAELSPSIRAFALTQRGHGDASRPASGYSAAGYAADVAGFLDAVGVERAIVVGHSLGSVVARHAAADHPERVLGLVLLGTFAAFGGHPAVAELWAEVSALEDPIDPAFARGFQESTVARPIQPGMLDAVTAESLKLDAAAWRAALGELVDFDDAERLAAIEAPTLIVWGDRDAFCARAEQDALVAGLPHAQLVVERGGGHAVHWEDPAGVARHVAAFAAEVVTNR